MIQLGRYQVLLIEDLVYHKEMSNYKGQFHGLDIPDHRYHTRNAPTGWWKDHPVQDFDYSFNSWGFRGPEYDQYVGQPVILCMGDSNTVNLGGPIEDSWASQLDKLTELPCINLGMDGAGNDAIKLCYDRAYKLFDVQETFVMYSYIHRRLIDKEFTHYVRKGFVPTLAGKTRFKEPPPATDLQNFEHFLVNRIPDAYESFIPEWCYTEEELGFINDFPHFPYPEGKQDKWSGRDFHHINAELNKQIAEYFYELSSTNT